MNFFDETIKSKEIISLERFELKYDHNLKRFVRCIYRMDPRLKPFKDFNEEEESREALEFVCFERETLRRNVQVVERRRKGIWATIELLKKKESSGFMCMMDELGKVKELLAIMEGDMRRIFD
jgi:hypothetical protein